MNSKAINKAITCFAHTSPMLILLTIRPLTKLYINYALQQNPHSPYLTHMHMHTHTLKPATPVQQYPEGTLLCSELTSFPVKRLASDRRQHPWVLALLACPPPKPKFANWVQSGTMPAHTRDSDLLLFVITTDPNLASKIKMRRFARLILHINIFNIGHQ